MGNGIEMLRKMIVRFQEAMRSEREARWIQGEIADQINAKFGYKGLEELSHATGLSMRKLDSLRYTARRIKPELREKYTKLSYSHFREAAQAAQKFAKANPDAAEADPEWWLKAAIEHGWQSDSLRAGARFHTPETSPESLTLADRVAWLQKKALAADHAFHEIEMAVARFNEQHAAYFGSMLEVHAIKSEAKAS